MSTTATLFPPASCIGLTPKQHYVETAAHEHATTLRVLRLADAQVPSIYGPTADEPWL